MALRQGGRKVDAVASEADMVAILGIEDLSSKRGMGGDVLMR
jgi:hypothetical protein